ncbi:glycosyltransferase [Blastococcus saxobsidens]|uniref:glycosyltransferase n=1 Tax=Blastococcus saxobsidens TaxID=138336 RepID=UPI0006880D75|nr:glycosyltransferase [Blastococcus saxobsidens]
MIKGLGAGGAERLLVSLARVSDRRRFHLTVAYVLPHKDALVSELAAAGVEVVPLLTEAPRGALRRNVAWARKLRQLLKRGDYDVVHTHSPVVAGVTRLLRLTLGKRTRPAMVSTEHNSWNSYVPATRWLNAVLHRRDDLRFAVSTECRNSMWRRWRPEVEVLAHGVVLEDYTTAPGRREEVRKELGIDPAGIVICTVANLRREKGYPELLDAAAVITQADSRAVFLAAGQGALADMLHREHERLRLGNRFRFLGQVDDVPNLLTAADIFVLPSRYEGQPIAIMEALCVGLPVVATRVGGIPEQVRHGVEGLLVPPRDTHALVAALTTLIEDEERRRRMGLAARDRGQAFDIRLACRRLERGYMELAYGRATVHGPGRQGAPRILRPRGAAASFRRLRDRARR